MEEKEFRGKVTLMNFLCCVLVIWHHSGNADLFAGAHGVSPALDFFENTLTFAVIRADIPAFFMLSGYLFFRNFTWAGLPGKWRRRVRSLLIPYLFWNLFWYFARLLASGFGPAASLPGLAPVPADARTLIRAAFCYAYNPVFWFMYQLILLVILAPVIRFFLLSRWSSVLYGLFLLWVFLTWPALPIVNQDALIYYSLGAFWAVWGKEAVEREDSPRRALAGLFGVFLSLILCLLNLRTGRVQFLVAYLALLPQAVWLLLPLNAGGIAGKSPWMGCTFFIYATHFVLVRAINKVGGRIFPGSTVAGFLFYLAMPAVVIVIVWAAAGWLKKHLPGVWLVVNGNRK